MSYDSNDQSFSNSAENKQIQKSRDNISYDLELESD